VRTQELKMAASLIDTMTEDFDPSLYRDAYREALESLVQAKIEGNEVVRPAGTGVAPEKGPGPLDLTETLRASVEAAKASRAKGATSNAAGEAGPKAGAADASGGGRGEQAEGGTGDATDSVPPPRRKPKSAPRRRASA
jgi:DNA end-binding protein Ku